MLGTKEEDHKYLCPNVSSPNPTPVQLDMSNYWIQLHSDKEQGHRKIELVFPFAILCKTHLLLGMGTYVIPKLLYPRLSTLFFTDIFVQPPCPVRHKT